MRLITVVAALASLATIEGTSGENRVDTIWDEVKETITCAGCEVCSQLKSRELRIVMTCDRDFWELSSWSLVSDQMS
jgi:hypothetical protein